MDRGKYLKIGVWLGIILIVFFLFYNRSTLIDEVFDPITGEHLGEVHHYTKWGLAAAFMLIVSAAYWLIIYLYPHEEISQ